MNTFQACVSNPASLDILSEVAIGGTICLAIKDAQVLHRIKGIYNSTSFLGKTREKFNMFTLFMKANKFNCDTTS